MIELDRKIIGRLTKARRLALDFDAAQKDSIDREPIAAEMLAAPKFRAFRPRNRPLTPLRCKATPLSRDGVVRALGSSATTAGYAAALWRAISAL